MRAIVKSAKNVGELVYQFVELDRVTWKQVDEFYSDTYIVLEAKYRLEIATENLEYYTEDDIDDYAIWLKDSRQLKRFINTWEGKCQPHKNDGIQWEELEAMIKGAK
jgi:hypothetical protein